jgi:hypothetical protein
MANTTITPTIGANTLAGVAGAMGLALAPAQAIATATGVAPSLTAANTLNPGTGLPVSWSGLAAGAAGAATPPMAWRQAKFQVSGVFGAAGSLLIQGSPDGINWTALAGVSGPASADVTQATVNRALTGGNGLQVIQLPGTTTVVISITDWIGPGFPFLRAAVQGGDGTTSLSVTGNVSTTGCV